MHIIRLNAKSAFTPTRIPGARWVINQYVGCEHNCLYCYAKFMCRWYPFGRWGSWVVVKENLPELVKGRHVDGKVYMSSVSDPYQPIERELKLTRRLLTNMDKSVKLSILTKSPLVLRDIDLFQSFEDLEVGLTVNSFNRSVEKVLEPLSPSSRARIDALRVLHENGVRNYAFISPIIPGLTNLRLIIEETKDFTDFYWLELMNLRASGKEFRDWLRRNHPESYLILSENDRIEEYMKDTITLLRDEDIPVKGICVHHLRSRSFNIYRI